MEEIAYSILFRWFVGLNLDEKAWDAKPCTKNGNRLLETAVAREFLAPQLGAAQGWFLDEQFTLDGSLGEPEDFQSKQDKLNATGRPRRS